MLNTHYGTGSELHAGECGGLGVGRPELPDYSHKPLEKDRHRILAYCYLSVIMVNYMKEKGAISQQMIKGKSILISGVQDVFPRGTYGGR